MIVDFLIWWAKRTPFTHIPGYMNRWWIIPYTKFPEWAAKRSALLRWIERKVPAVRLHEILRSDNDRQLHDHPWTFISIILRGGYWETRPLYDRAHLYEGVQTRWRGPGSIQFRRHFDFHKLSLPGTEWNGDREEQRCWTLFITFACRQKWGYLVHPAYKMRYEEYQAAHPSGDPAVEHFRSAAVQRHLGEGYEGVTHQGGPEGHIYRGGKTVDANTGEIRHLGETVVVSHGEDGKDYHIYPQVALDESKRIYPRSGQLASMQSEGVSASEYYWSQPERNRRKREERVGWPRRRTDWCEHKQVWDECPVCRH